VIPNKVKIHGQIYRIIQEEDNKMLNEIEKRNVAEKRDKSYPLGCCSESTNTIYLRYKHEILGRPMPKERIMSVLWHEIIHAMLCESGTEKISWLDEESVSIISRGIYQILKENKGIREMMA